MTALGLSLAAQVGVAASGVPNSDQDIGPPKRVARRAAGNARKDSTLGLAGVSSSMKFTQVVSSVEGQVPVKAREFAPARSFAKLVPLCLLFCEVWEPAPTKNSPRWRNCHTPHQANVCGAAAAPSTWSRHCEMRLFGCRR